MKPTVKICVLGALWVAFPQRQVLLHQTDERMVDRYVQSIETG